MTAAGPHEDRPAESYRKNVVGRGLRAPSDRKNILLLHFTRSAAAAQNAGGMDKPIPMPDPPPE